MTRLPLLRRRWFLVVAAALVVLVLFGPRLATFYTDVLWYQSLGFAEVLWGQLGTQATLAAVAGLITAVLVGGNLAVTLRVAPAYRLPSKQEEIVERYRQALVPRGRLIVIAVAVVTGVLSGSAVVGAWRTVLLYQHGGTWGIEDPHFGIDLGFFVFDLPFLTALNSWLFVTLLIVIAASLAGHYVFGGLRPQAPAERITGAANVHLSILLALLIGVRAWGFWLDRYLLSYSERGITTGLSYTDVNAQLRGYQLLTVIAVVCALLFLANIRVRGWLLPSAGVAILLVAFVILGGIYPAVIQRFQVAPQELEREREFIARNIEMTSYAYLLDPEHVSTEQFAAASDLSAEELERNRAVLESIRLWDPATLENTYRQLQELRPYYDFRDVDIDRYDVEGDRLQVMISARELSEEDLPQATWQNQRLVFTHGFGVVSSRVSTAGADGQPEFLANNIPVEAVDALELEEPRIYFGENPPEYSIVGTEVNEFDVELADEVQTTRFQGDSGVQLSGPLRRLAFALRYAEPNILLSALVGPESRVLFHRDVRDRVQSVAPFLQLDHDPYPTVVGGEVVWVIDGYTSTDMVPYSQRVDLAEMTRYRELGASPSGSGQSVFETTALEGRSNYLRNAVKATVNAYDGSVTLYVTDPEDPLIQAWDRAFPEILTPLDEAPMELREHFRYPEDLFNVQRQILTRYHIEDPDAFYTQSDGWAIPDDIAFVSNQSVQSPNQAVAPREFPASYQLLRLPGEEEEEFALITPFTPRERDVLSAYLAARGDPDSYGQLRILEMPPNRTVFGPEQVQARINQDDAVSEQITLWNQSGSRVVYGNLIVLPIADSLLYAQPLFLRAEESDIPELRRVVLVYGDRVEMGNRLSDTLEALFGAVDVLEEEPLPVDGEPLPGDDGPPPPPPPPPGDADPAAADPEVQALVAEALTAFAAAEAALMAGDLAGYAEETANAEAALQRLDALLSGEAPPTEESPEPEAAPSPEAPPTEAVTPAA